MNRSIRNLAACAAVCATVLACIRFGAPAPEARWSDPATWNGHVPRAGENMTIPRGRAIVLDVSPPHLASLAVDGSLRFDERDLVVRAGGIAIRGTLRVGTEERPFAHRAEIVLDGAADGRGAIAVSSGGRLDLHGTPRVSWTTLGATAHAGDRSVVLADAVDWRAGDRIAIAPSGFEPREAEEMVLTSAAGASVRLASPLRFRHWGTFASGVDERAEVGLLSHNVVVRGEPVAAARGVGGQVIVLRGGTLRASDVEFRALGQRGRIGRYPIHFHEAGDASGSIVAASSVDHNFNRCVTIHGTSGVVVRDDVAYDTIGHCYFLEDGIERANVFDHDLGMLVRAAAPNDAVLETDARPAVFWIANPDNVVRGDRAAGSDGAGFWYDLGVTPGGLASGDRDVRPRSVALETFSDDVAHANEHDGLFVDNLHNPPGVRAAPNYEPTVTAHFRNFTSYKNRRHGVWLRGVRLKLDDPRLADNAIGATFAAANTSLRGGLIVGATANETGPPKPEDPSFPIRGFEFYDGPVAVESTRFVDFEPDGRREASALSALEYSPFFMDPNQSVRNLTFENARPLFLRRFDVDRDANAAADGYRSLVIRDLDGSLAGARDRSVVYGSPLLTDGCTPLADANAAVCAGRFGSLFVVDGTPDAAGIGPVRISKDGNDAASIVLGGNPTGGAAKISFQTNVASDGRYVLRFEGHLPHRFRLAVHGLDDGDRIDVRIPQIGDCLPLGGVTLVARGPERRAAAVRDVVCSSILAMGHIRR